MLSSHKQALQATLFSRLRELGAFWSYDVHTVSDIPTAVLIDHALRYGDVPELFLLFDAFSRTAIKKVWHETFTDALLYGRNYYLAKIFFDIAYPKRYIEKHKPLSRYEKLASNSLT